MFSEQDDETVQRHRAASALRSERPADSVRATVLAAAARAVDAKPADAARPSAASKRDALRRYQPLSAAALLVVSVLTGLVALQAYRERPERIVAEQHPSRPSAAPPATSAGPIPASSPPAPAAAAPVDEARAQSAAPPAPATVPGQGATQGASSNAVAPLASAAQSRQSRRRNAAPIASPESDRARTPDREALASAAGRETRPSRIQDRTPSPQDDASNAASHETSSAPAAAGAVSEEPGVVRQPAPARKMSRGAAAPSAFSLQEVEPATPELWVERIARLREEHRDEDADRELARLRERFPAFVVPSRALRAAHDR